MVLGLLDKLVRVAMAVLCVFVAVFLVSFALHRCHCLVSFARHFHVSLECGELFLYSDLRTGPYNGSIIGLTGQDGQLIPRLERRIAWGDTAGIYFRYFCWPDAATLWTLRISLLWPIAFCLCLPAIKAVVDWRSGKSTQPSQP